MQGLPLFGRSQRMMLWDSLFSLTFRRLVDARTYLVFADIEGKLENRLGCISAKPSLAHLSRVKVKDGQFQ